jgi:hypothetical protein
MRSALLLLLELLFNTHVDLGLSREGKNIHRKGVSEQGAQRLAMHIVTAK